MPHSETVALVKQMSRPAFDENRNRKLFPALAAVEGMLHEQPERDRRAQETY